VLSSPRMRCTLAAATLENGGRDALLLLVCGASAAFSLLVPTSHIQINVKLCLFFGFKVDSSLSSLQHDLTKLATAVYFL